MPRWEDRQPQRGSIVRFWHESATVVPQWRRGVVVRARGSELDVVPGLGDPPPHADFFKLENPTRRSGLAEMTYFDLRDVNTPLAAEVQVLGVFPHRRFDDLIERLAELGAVEPG